MPKEDELLWQNIQNGDATAFNNLFNTYWENLFQYAYRTIRQKQDAEEIVQNLFIYLWKKKGDIHITTSLNAYLYAGIRNRCINYISARKTVFIDVETANLQQVATLAIDKTAAADINTLLNNSVKTLPQKMGQVFIMHNLQSLSIAEIAACTQTSPQTVRNQLNAAVKKMRIIFARALPIIFLHFFL